MKMPKTTTVLPQLLWVLYKRSAVQEHGLSMVLQRQFRKAIGQATNQVQDVATQNQLFSYICKCVLIGTRVILSSHWSLLWNLHLSTVQIASYMPHKRTWLFSIYLRIGMHWNCQWQHCLEAVLPLGGVTAFCLVALWWSRITVSAMSVSVITL